MLKAVNLTGHRRLDEYRSLIDDSLYLELKELGRQMKGKRVLQVNSTAVGGGVAEILKSEIPLLRDLGVDCDWQVMQADESFFRITKKIHNGLQGARSELSTEQWALYESVNREVANSIHPEDWDYIVIHDPQPAASLGLMSGRGGAKWIWRCHIDSRHAYKPYLDRFITYLSPYDGVIFTMQKYVLEGFKPAHLGIIPMAIDPLDTKNQLIGRRDAEKLVTGFGIDLGHPLITQISRFDPWKDPVGVVKAWQIARKTVPGLQLALIGQTAADDPESEEILTQVERAVRGLDGVFIIANQADDRAVNAFQAVSDVILQKSLREGFALTVTEALWAGTPVIGADIGGIPLQVEDGKSGYLVTSVEECAERIVALIQNPVAARQMGEYGRDLVRHRFLLPRLVRDNLKFWLSL